MMPVRSGNSLCKLVSDKLRIKSWLDSRLRIHAVKANVDSNVLTVHFRIELKKFNEQLILIGGTSDHLAALAWIDEDPNLSTSLPSDSFYRRTDPTLPITPQKLISEIVWNPVETACADDDTHAACDHFELLIKKGLQCCIY